MTMNSYLYSAVQKNKPKKTNQAKPHQLRKNNVLGEKKHNTT